MRLNEELYFEITVEGEKAHVSKFLSFLTSGVLDDFFEFTSDYIIYGDDYHEKTETEKVNVTLANDDCGIEISSLNPEKFLDVLCSGATDVSLDGNLFDIDDEEYRFVSYIGEDTFVNSDDIDYSDELDLEARREDYGADDWSDDED